MAGRVLAGVDAVLLGEAFGKVGWAAEAYLVADFVDAEVALVEQLCCPLQPDELYHLVGRDVGERLYL